MIHKPSKISILAASCLLTLTAGAAWAGARYDLTVVDTFEFDVPSGGSLAVDVPDADIEVEVGAAGRVVIEMQLSARDLADARSRYDAMNFRASARGESVTLEADRARGVWGIHSRGHFRVVAHIRVPERFDVDLRTNDGDVTVEAIDGRLSIKTQDGDVAIGRATTSGEARIMSSDGDISIDELVGDEVAVSTSDGDISVGRADTNSLTLRSSDGDISADRISGALEASTNDGDMSIGIERLDDMTLKSGDGDIEIRADAAMRAELDLTGDEIAFRRNAAAFEGEIRERSARGNLNGGGPKLAAASRDGSVTLSLR